MSNPTMNTDVWSQVFEVAVDENPSSLSAIRSVDRTWFETAGSTPKLWSKLELSRKVHFTDADYVRTHLQNSGGLPLDITIILPDDVPYDSPIPAIDDLRKVLERIKSLTIDVPFHEAWQRFVLGIGEGHAAPLLERLILRVKGDVWSNNTPFTTLSTSLTPSPMLTHLQIPAWPLPVTPPPQLSTVTSLAFDTPFSGLDIPALFPLVQATPNLQHFAFKSVDMGAESDPAFSNLLTVPHLRSANVTVPGFGLDLLRNFKAPLLTDVRLDGFRDVVPDHVWDEEDWGIDLTQPATNILEHLSTHSPNIRRLELYYVQFQQPKEDFIRILKGQAFPDLEELVLVRTNLPDEALVESAGVASRLKKLGLHKCKYVSGAGLLSFAQGRTKENLSLFVEGCPRLSKEDVESLSKVASLRQQQ